MDFHSDDDALATIQKWGWPDNDPRFDFQVPYRTPLSVAINRLAMEGHQDPAGAVLSLLIDGRLEATGNYRWTTYRDGLFKRDGNASIPATRWSALKEATDYLKRVGIRNEVLLHFTGEEWGADTVPRAEWAWREDRFLVACAKGRYGVRDDRAEEVFSASAIELRPAEVDAATSDVTVEKNRGGSPPKYDWERAVAAVVFQWADEGSWQPEMQAEVKKRLADWFAEQDQYPSESMLKERARWLFAEFQQRNGKADNLAA